MIFVLEYICADIYESLSLNICVQSRYICSYVEIYIYVCSYVFIYLYIIHAIFLQVCGQSGWRSRLIKRNWKGVLCVAVCCRDAVRCSVLRCVAVWRSRLIKRNWKGVQCVAVFSSVLQCFAVCCSVLQCVAGLCSLLQCVAVCCSVLQCVAVRLMRAAGQKEFKQ